MGHVPAEEFRCSSCDGPSSGGLCAPCLNITRAAATDLNFGHFAEWSTADLAAQCRMQARENLDPEYSRFMCAVADRLRELAASAPDPIGTPKELSSDHGRQK